MNTSVLLCLSIVALSTTASANDSEIPKEYSSLISAYTVGRISLAELRDVCQWTTPGEGVREDLAYARRQNIQFCAGFLSGTLAIANLEKSDITRLADADENSTPSCKVMTTTKLKEVALSKNSSKHVKKNASKFLYQKILDCGVR